MKPENTEHVDSVDKGLLRKSVIPARFSFKNRSSQFKAGIVIVCLFIVAGSFLYVWLNKNEGSVESDGTNTTSENTEKSMQINSLEDLQKALSEAETLKNNTDEEIKALDNYITTDNE